MKHPIVLVVILAMAVAFLAKTESGSLLQYQQAEVMLSGEGIGRRYADKNEDGEDDNAWIFDVILDAADEQQRDFCMDFTKKELPAELNNYADKLMYNRNNEAEFTRLKLEEDTIIRNCYGLRDMGQMLV